MRNHKTIPEEGGLIMTEQTITRESAPKSKAMTILRQIFQWSILALVLLTCIMAAYRKFGG
jgi:hypothetical protein